MASQRFQPEKNRIFRREIENNEKSKENWI